MWLLLLTLWLLFAPTGNSTGNALPNQPSAVNVGALFTFDSVIGNAVKTAIEAAVEDVNANANILNTTRLNLIMQDTDCDGFIGFMQALRLMENKEVVAVLGPQSSGIAHAISHVVDELHIPLVSFAATDPSLASLQHPYFLGATQNDYFQMNAVADLVAYYGWREVASIFVDDDYGRGGVSALSDALSKKRSKISYKAPFPADADMAAIRDLLSELNLTESRVFVVHVNPDSGLGIFKVAKQMGMMANGYVWIATDWLSSRLDSSELTGSTMDLIQGVICLRQHVPDSALKTRFMSTWKKKKNSNSSSLSPNSFAFYAYDSVWIISHAIDKLLNDGLNISFSPDPNLPDGANGSLLDFSALDKFDRGDSLLRRILLSNFTGLTGSIQFDSDRNLINPSYGILNIVKTKMKRIGFWTNHSGLSVIPPEAFYRNPPHTSRDNQKLDGVIWPGESTVQPRGWDFPGNGKPLRIGVPYRASYRQFASKDDSNITGSGGISGYCIDVFEAAVKLLPYPVLYNLSLFGDGVQNPSYKQLVMAVENNTFDAAVGDITIVTNRTRVLDFTQPYVESGLVIVTTMKERNSNEWSFLKPFTIEMWLVTCAFFLFVGVVVWILEHRLNTEFRGPPRQQVVTIFWFSFSTMFYAHRENMQSTLARLVVIVWLFVVLIITSSYTANLTSFLTVQQLSPGAINDLGTLLASSDPIGFQKGSFTQRYMIENMNVANDRLVPLGSPAEYARALEQGPRFGGVVAIVDERPYVDLFLSTHCKFKTVGLEFTKTGWGFGFQKDSPLAVDLSTAILTLSENGQLQRIRDKWMKLDSSCSSLSDSSYFRLNLDSFWGLFLICGVACSIALVVFFSRLFCQYRKYVATQRSIDDSSHESQSYSSSNTLREKSLNKLWSFVDSKEADVKNSFKQKTSPQYSPGASSSSSPT